MSKETFSATFDNGTTVTVEIDISRFKSTGGGQLDWIKAQWQPALTRAVVEKILPQYIEWMHTVIGHVANKVNDKIMYAYPGAGPHKSRFFLYHPDGRFEEVQPPK